MVVGIFSQPAEAIVNLNTQARHAGLQSRVNPVMTWRQVRWQAYTNRPSSKGESMRYAVIIEKAESNFSAYVPDLPGCVATGASLEDTESNIREAIALHVQGMREDGLPVPMPTTVVEYCEPAA
jgi:predicted RNase H-like HicB family nuclease